jgi:hypothetical protein
MGYRDGLSMRPYRHGPRPIGVPPLQLPEGHLKTTAFLCLEQVGVGGVQPVPVATAFFVFDRSVAAPYPVWVVTARHCIQEARASGRQMYLRVNTKDSFVDIPTNPDDWHESTSSDVALAYWLGPPECVITSVPLDQFVGADYRYHGAADLPIAADIAKMGGQLVLVGHEVFFVGLFSQHAGRERNLPIARFGAVSRQPSEPISVQRSDGSIEELEGYLVEARSWGGHSGSPVFWYYPISEVFFVPDPTARPMNREARRRAGAKAANQRQIPISREGGLIALLGLVSAHFDIPQQAQTQGDVLGQVVTNINAGIAVVTPAHHIRELIESEPVQEERDHYRGQDQNQPAATFDSVPADAGTGVGNERLKPWPAMPCYCSAPNMP